MSGIVSSAGESGALTTQGVTGHDSALDMTDVMDISCDPPGPSASRTLSSTASPSVSRVSSRPSSHVGEEIQAVTTRLHQVAVTPSGSARASPYIHRTPSLEDNRALTSSAEELSSTLGSGFRVAEPVDSVWVPIDRPERKSTSCSPEFIQVDRPEAVPVRTGRELSSSPWDVKCSVSKSPLYKEMAISGSEQKSSFRQSACSPREIITSGRERIPSTEKSVALDNSTVKAKRDGLTLGNSDSLKCDTRSSHKSSSVSPRELSTSTISHAYQNRSESNSVASKTNTKVYTGAIAVGKDDPPVGHVYSDVAKFSMKYDSPEGFKLENTLSTQKNPCPPLSKTVTSTTQDTEHREPSLVSNSKTKKCPSTTTSEDDLLLSESKKEPKKKKKKTKMSQFDDLQPQPDISCSLGGSQNLLVDVSESADYICSKTSSQRDEPLLPPDAPTTAGASLEFDFDADHFHTAKEYHELPVEKLEEFDELHREDFQEASESVVQTLEDFELHGDEEEKGIRGQEETMLRSIHDDNDLARALEEAYSSDDNLPMRTKTQTRTHSRSRPSRNSEMFPFKDDTSDDEDQVKLRRRIVVSSTITVSASRSSMTDDTSTDDRGETSGDDRGESSTDDRKTGTSESDVGASPNPRASSSSKSKKKKKKKR